MYITIQQRQVSDNYLVNYYLVVTVDDNAVSRSL